ncbi:hypothetical protein [Clavibacter sp. CFBP 8614]|uniref:hypothetical protein n=1 Tax=unclassified Clavibacter TaxID=2626594 RepID=UPI004041CE17
MRGRRRGGGWKRALVSAVDEHARSLGYETVVAPKLAAGHVDLLVRTPQVLHLIRIELENVEGEEAAREHDIIRRYREPQRSTRVLWLTYDCHWVDTRIPAFGVRLVTDTSRPEDALDVGGLSAIVDAGILQPDRHQMLRQPAVSEFGLALVLQQYLAGKLHHDIAGGVERTAYYGWASTGKWLQMMQALVRRNRALGREIRDRIEERDAALRSASIVEGDLAKATCRLDEMKIELATREQQLATREQQLAARDQQLAALERRHSQAKDCLRAVEVLRGTTFGRIYLRRVPVYAEKPSD